MASEDLLFHGKQTLKGVRIYEFPAYKIVYLGPGQWNVLCAAFGDSGYRNTEAECKEWVRRHITNYVHLSELVTLQAKLDKVECKIKELGYDTIEEFTWEHAGD